MPANNSCDSGRDTDDPGPNRQRVAGGNDRVFAGGRAVVDQKEDGTVGVSGHVCEFASVRQFGVVLSRVGVFRIESVVFLFVCKSLTGTLA